MHTHSRRVRFGAFEADLPMLFSAVARDQRSAEAWMHLGLGYARRADFAAAVPALERAVALAPGAERPRYWLAWARAQRHSS